MRIAIVGAAGEGKTHLVDKVIFPALCTTEAWGYGFRIYDGGVLTAHRGGKPEVVIATFNDPQVAQKFLEGKVLP